MKFDYIPVFLLILVARILKYSPQAWQYGFICGSIAAISVTVFNLYQNQILDRLALGINTFLIIGAVSFLLRILPILLLYRDHKGIIFFTCIILVGIITTIATPTKFIGIAHHDAQKLTIASIKLLACSVACLIFAELFKSYDLFLVISIPFILLRLARDYLVKELEA